MTERTQLGRIQRATFGFGGYQDAQFGLSLQFGGESWAVNTFIGAWGMKPSESAKWTHDENLKLLGDAAWKLLETLQAAKKADVAQLIDTPVECTFHNFNELKSWRVLTEVL